MTATSDMSLLRNRVWMYIRLYRLHYVFLAFVTTAICVLLLQNAALPKSSVGPIHGTSTSFFKLPPMSSALVAVSNYTQLKWAVTSLPSRHRHLATAIYEIRSLNAQMTIPSIFADKVRRMFSAYPGDKSDLGFISKQNVVVVYNRYTFEETLYNPIRGYRPGYSDGLPPEKDEQLRAKIQDSQKDCDFCNTPPRAAVDVWGSIESTHCYVASNVAKYNGFHSLVLSRQHSPLGFTHEILADMLATAGKYFEKVNSVDPTMVYPHIMWDNLPRSSASQLHLHWQASISSGHYYARAAQMKDSAQRYELRYGSSFWADVVTIHEALGLAVRKGDAVAMAYITPTKEKELIVLGSSATSPHFATLFWLVLKTLTEGLGVRAFSTAILYEPLPNANAGPYPAIARVVDRGDPFDVRNDVGAMEMYGAYNVASDSFHVARKLRHFAKDVI